MKNFLLYRSTSSLALFGSFIFLAYTSSIAPKGIIDHFKVGDVVYSILDTTQFKKLHGSGWRLLSADEDIKGTDLFKFYRGQLIADRLPEGRGVFLRAMNVGRKSLGDPDGLTRLVGSSQSSAVGDHVHYFTTHNGSLSKQPYALGTDAKAGTNGGGETSGMKNPGPETRPRNITLYLYIKVDEE